MPCGCWEEKEGWLNIPRSWKQKCRNDQGDPLDPAVCMHPQLWSLLSKPMHACDFSLVGTMKTGSIFLSDRPAVEWRQPEQDGEVVPTLNSVRTGAGGWCERENKITPSPRFPESWWGPTCGTIVFPPILSRSEQVWRPHLLLTHRDIPRHTKHKSSLITPETSIVDQTCTGPHPKQLTYLNLFSTTMRKLVLMRKVLLIPPFYRWGNWHREVAWFSQDCTADEWWRQVGTQSAGLQEPHS